MRGIHGAEEEGGGPVEVEQVDARQHAHGKRYCQRQKSECEASVEVKAQMVHVNLQTGEEHEV